MVFLLGISMPTVGGIKDTIVESPFYLRARIHDSQTASVQFEIARENNQRTCQMYKFTIRRNREYPYSMPEQNLTFWSNSLELKHLAAGEYRICAIICSEYLKQAHSYLKKNNSLPISTCIDIHVYRSHFLVLTLYFLVVLILTFSQIIFTLRKRKFQARIKTALVEIEDILHKWRTDETLLTSDEQRQSYCILQNLVTLPASPVEHSITSPFHPPIVFHLDMSSEQSILEIP